MITKRIIALIAVTVACLLLLIHTSSPIIIVHTRDLIFAVYQRAFPRSYDPSSPSHVTAVDEIAISEFGQWPWPRTYLAQLTGRLFVLGAVALGFAKLFVVSGRTSTKQVDLNSIT